MLRKKCLIWRDWMEYMHKNWVKKHTCHQNVCRTCDLICSWHVNLGGCNVLTCLSGKRPELQDHHHIIIIIILFNFTNICHFVKVHNKTCVWKLSKKTHWPSKCWICENICRWCLRLVACNAPALPFKHATAVTNYKSLHNFISITLVSLDDKTSLKVCF